MSLVLPNVSTWIILLVVELSSLSKTRMVQYNSFQLLRQRKLYVSFLCLTGYKRRFVETFAAVAVALTNLTKTNSPHKVVWTEACEQAFTKLKELLCSASILMSPDFEKSFVLQTNASKMCCVIHLHINASTLIHNVSQICSEMHVVIVQIQSA